MKEKKTSYRGIIVKTCYDGVPYNAIEQTIKIVINLKYCVYEYFVIRILRPYSHFIITAVKCKNCNGSNVFRNCQWGELIAQLLLACHKDIFVPNIVSLLYGK